MKENQIRSFPGIPLLLLFLALVAASGPAYHCAISARDTLLDGQ